MLEDWAALLIAGVVLLGLVLLAEVVRHLVAVSASTSRRWVHVGVGLCVAGIPALFSGPELVYLLAVLFVLINLAAWRWGHFRSIHGTRPASLGTVTFPLALLPALALTWSADPARLGALQIGFVVLALADPLAAWIGSRFGEGARYRLGGNEKSWAGSAAFFAAALVITGGGLMMWNSFHTQADDFLTIAVVAFAVAGGTTAVEALGQRGWDNFFIPLTAIIMLIFALEQPDAVERLIRGGLAGFVFGLLAYRLRFLRADGAVAGGLLAASLIGLGGWAWAVPAFIFFFLSSLLTRWRAREKRAAVPESEQGGNRDAGQVYANGGIGWALLLVYVAFPQPSLYLGFLGAFAAAAADTWATELGMLSRTSPRHVLTWRRVPRGTSGAVTAQGTAAALAGAASVAGAAWLSWPEEPALPAGWGASLVLLCGFVGAYADSLAGAALERKAPAGASDDGTAGGRGGPYRQEGGKLRLSNNQVNAIGTAMGALLALISWHVIV